MCALGTRRIMALARKTGRPAHIVHVSTAEEFAYLRGFRDIATCEVLLNHLTQIGPDCYERLGGYAVMNPPIRDQASLRGGVGSGAQCGGGYDRLRPCAAQPRRQGAALAGDGRRADRGANPGADHAGPCECRAADASAAWWI
jgi:hypothetical protein